MTSASHMVWAATTPQAANQAFNVVNGDVFRWSWMWGRIAEWFGLEPAPFDGSPLPLDEQMRDDGPLWRALADRSGLIEPDLTRLASPWHTDADLGRPIESSPTWARAVAWASPPISPQMTPSSTSSRNCAETI